MNDENLAELCRTVYRDNKDAIDLILRYGKPTMPDENQMKRFHQKTNTNIDEKQRTKGATKNYSFIPDEWKKLVPATNLFTQDKWLVFYNFFFDIIDSKQIYLSLNVGNFQDAKLRKQFIDILAEKIEKKLFKDKPLKINNKSLNNTALVSCKRSINDTILSKDDTSRNDELINIMISMYKNDEKIKAYRQCVDEALAECPIWTDKKIIV